MRLGPAFAKVNLALEVTGHRPDGYHDLRTVFLLIDWHDLVQIDLRADPGAAGHSVEVGIGGPQAQPGLSAPDAPVAPPGPGPLEHAIPPPPAPPLTVPKTPPAPP